MKHLIKKMVCVTLVFSLILSAFVFSENIYAKKKFKVKKKKVSMELFDTISVKYTAPKKAKVKSSKKKVVKVTVKKKKIIIEGLKVGKTKLTVRCGKKKAFIKVTVKDIVSGEEATAAPVDVINAAKALEPQAKSVNSFGAKSFSMLKKDSENTLISPFSIHMAFSMLTNGAKNETYNQLVNTLRISDMNAWNEAMKTYSRGSLNENIKLNIANSVWLSDNFDKSPDMESGFIAPLKTYYNAEVFKNVVFDVNTAKKINYWVNNKTNEMIPSIVEEEPMDDLSMMLINALYFEAEWAAKFSKNNVKDEPFYGVSDTNNVKMMNMSKIRRKYYMDDKFECIEIPYKYGNYAMDIYMSSDKSKTAGQIWKSLTDAEKEDMLALFKSDNIKYENILTLKLPQFKIDYSVDEELKSVLKGMGITDAFDEYKADLSRIGNLYVGEVIHKTAIDVHCDGTKAAAVTAIKAYPTSAMPTEPPVYDIEYIVDRPFIYTIRDTVSGMVLFLGEVNNLEGTPYSKLNVESLDLSVTNNAGKLVITIKNNTGKELGTGYGSYTLYKLENGKWNRVPLKDGTGPAVPDIALIVKPGQSVDDIFSVTDYFENPESGTYRLYKKDFTGNNIYAEFSI